MLDLALLTLLATTALASPTPQSTTPPPGSADPSTYRSPGMFTLYNVAPGPYENWALVTFPLGTSSIELHLDPSAQPSPAYLNGTASQLQSPNYAYLNFAGPEAKTEYCVNRPEIGDQPGIAQSFLGTQSTTSWSKQGPNFMVKDGSLDAKPDAANNMMVACEGDGGVVRLKYANPEEAELAWPSGCVLASLSTATAEPSAAPRV